MNWTENQIKEIVLDMASENPMACRSLLEISEIEFTDRVPTMAVSLGNRPVLKINLDFCRKTLLEENEVKCVLLHEFLHVLLLHTINYKSSDSLLNIALDAIINAIIHRLKGPEYSDFFCRYYKIAPVEVILRPVNAVPWNNPFKDLDPMWEHVHGLIYKKGYCADELHELLQSMQANGVTAGVDQTDVPLLGNHAEQPISASTRQLLDETMEKLNGVDIWKKYQRPGTGLSERDESRQIRAFRMHRWKSITTDIIRKCLSPEKSARVEYQQDRMMLPVLSPTDRRAFLRFRPGGLIPLSNHELTIPQEKKLATVYLDVSGSMDAELEALSSLLYSLRSDIRLPLFAFSDQIAVATFKDGKLQTRTSGGTDINSVFKHIQSNKIERALIITDGYIDQPNPALIKDLDKKHIHFLITNQGGTQVVENSGFPYRLLPVVDWS